jgi:hypothetical protein
MRSCFFVLLLLVLGPIPQALANDAQPAAQPSGAQSTLSFLEFKAQPTASLIRPAAASTDKPKFEMVISTRGTSFPDMTRGGAGRLECAIPRTVPYGGLRD